MVHRFCFLLILRSTIHQHSKTLCSKPSVLMGLHGLHFFFCPDTPQGFPVTQLDSRVHQNRPTISLEKVRVEFLEVGNALLVDQNSISHRNACTLWYISVLRESEQTLSELHYPTFCLFLFLWNRLILNIAGVLTVVLLGTFISLLSFSPDNLSVISFPIEFRC